MTRPAEGDPEEEGSSGMLGGNGGVAVRQSYQAANEKSRRP